MVKLKLRTGALKPFENKCQVQKIKKSVKITYKFNSR